MEHFYQRVEGHFDFENIYSAVVNTLPPSAHIVEVGAWKGKSTSYMAVEIARSGKSIQFDSVDTWEEGSSWEMVNEIGAKNLYEQYLENVAPAQAYINNKKMTSMQAVNDYEDASLDFVFIDASHEYADVKDDIQAWIKKVKPGCYIGGHDYPGAVGVKQAVDELLPEARHVPPSSWIYQIPAVDSK